MKHFIMNKFFSNYLIILLLTISTYNVYSQIDNNMTDELKLNDIDNPKFYSILISIEQQKLFVINSATNDFIKEYQISSSKYGEGSIIGSNKTPLGIHIIKEMIGDSAKVNEIIKNRMLTGRIATIHTDTISRESDDVTSRIMWLDGKEDNNKNSLSRYIYIHGTPEEGLIGTKASHGCIRMNNLDVIELFNMVNIGTPVDIQEFNK